MVGPREGVCGARGFLDSKGMGATDDWLSGCVEYFCSENPSGSLRDLYDMVHGQWTLSDLRDMSPGVLPPRLGASLKTLLPNEYALQLDSVLDVGAPAYKQLQQARKVDTDNDRVTHGQQDDGFETRDAPAQRMLKLSLTDGVQNVHAIEYRPIKKLRSTLTPGIKVLIKGPVVCRRGILMLEEHNLTILGGEVEDLLETNSYVNVLLRKINANTDTPVEISAFDPVRINPIDVNPIRDTTRINSAPNVNAIPRTHPLNVNPTTRTNSVPNMNPTFRMNPTREATRTNSVPNTNRSNGNVNVVQPNNSARDAFQSSESDIMFDDDNIDLMQLEAIENQVINNEVLNNPRMKPESPLVLNDDDSFDNYYANRSPGISYSPPISLGSTSPSLDVQPTTSEPTIVSVRQLKDSSQKEVVLKARVFKVVGKLSLQKTAWILRCTLTDDLDNVDVSFESDVLSTIIGYTPDDMIKLKKQMSAKPDLKQKLMEALDNAMNKVQKLNCLFHVALKESGPCVVKVEEIK